MDAHEDGLPPGAAVALWVVCAVALPAAAGLLLSALANRLSFAGVGILMATGSAVWLSRAIARRDGDLPVRALVGAGTASIAFGALARLEAEALRLGSAAVLGGAGLPWLAEVLFLAGLVVVVAAALVLFRRRRARAREGNL
jgi:hypothetical protein